MPTPTKPGDPNHPTHPRIGPELLAPSLFPGQIVILKKRKHGAGIALQVRHITSTIILFYSASLMSVFEASIAPDGTLYDCTGEQINIYEVLKPS